MHGAVEVRSWVPVELKHPRSQAWSLGFLQQLAKFGLEGYGLGLRLYGAVPTRLREAAPDDSQNTLTSYVSTCERRRGEEQASNSLRLQNASQLCTASEGPALRRSSTFSKLSEN